VLAHVHPYAGYKATASFSFRAANYPKASTFMLVGPTLPTKVFVLGNTISPCANRYNIIIQKYTKIAAQDESVYIKTHLVDPYILGF
jgi:hypothetical protein